MNITRGKIRKAQKVVIYGSEGIGKSTFASKFPDALFIDVEGSTNQLDVARLDAPTSWEMFAQQIRWVIANKPCKTLVIDTADWLEKLCMDYVVATYGKGEAKSIEDFGYGKGYTYLEENFTKMLRVLQDMVDSGINVVLTAHAIMRKFEQPDEMGAYDRWELKLHNKRVAPLIKEWSDLLLFANYKTMVVKDSKTGKARGQGGHRVMYTTHSPVWDAKNRHNLPDEMEFDFEGIKHIFEDIPAPKVEAPKVETPKKEPKAEPVPEPKQEPQKEPEKAPEEPLKTETSNSIDVETEDIEALPKALQDLMKMNGVKVYEIQRAVAAKGYYPVDTPLENYEPAFIEGVLIGAWGKVFELIEEQRTAIPF